MYRKKNNLRQSTLDNWPKILWNNKQQWKFLCTDMFVEIVKMHFIFPWSKTEVVETRTTRGLFTAETEELKLQYKSQIQVTLPL